MVWLFPCLFTDILAWWTEKLHKDGHGNSFLYYAESNSGEKPLYLKLQPQENQKKNVKNVSKWINTQ